MFGITQFLASAWRMKETGDSRNRAEFQANEFSPARMLSLGPNLAPNLGRIPPIEALAVPGVRIHLSPPHSLRVQRFSGRFGENPRILGSICISRGTRDRQVRAMPRRFPHFISVSNFAGAARTAANTQRARSTAYYTLNADNL
jgi:hypothetical protein